MKKLRLILPFTIALFVVPLGGCVTRCTGDPRTDSLGCASSNLSSGRYDRDTSRLASYAGSQQARAAEAKRTSAALDQERVGLTADANRLRASVASADSAIAEAQRSVARAQAEGRASSQQLAELSRQIAEVQSAKTQAERSQLEEEVRALEARVRQLRKIVAESASR